MRRLAVLLIGGAAAAGVAGHLAAQVADAVDAAALTEQLVAIEARTGGRLGVVVMDAAGDFLLAHRASERFALCSTFKLPLAAVVLDMAEQRRIRLNERLPFTDADIISLSPALEAARDRGEGTVTVREAIRSAVVFSDNGAANLVLRRLGGPAAFTRELHQRFPPAFAGATRLDRTEFTLNENLPGDARDTSSPRAMAGDLRHMLIDARSPLRRQSRALLIQWTRESETGLRRLRAGFGEAFDAGDKTGTCAPEAAPHRAYNDIGWFHPSGGSLGQGYSFAAFLDHPTVSRAEAEAALADVGRLAAAVVSERNAPMR